MSFTIKFKYSLRIFIHISILGFVIFEASGKAINHNAIKIKSIDPCGTNVLKSYQISSPPFLCSDPNINGFMFSLEGTTFSTEYYIIKLGTKPFLVEYNDGTFRLEIEVVMKADNSKEYLIEMVGAMKTIGTPLFGFTPATNYCANITPTTDWTFYNYFTIKLTGRNSNFGQILTFYSPQNNKHTFQIGQGANTWQPSLGSGLWFDNANTEGGVATIKGDLQIALIPYECCNKSICVPYKIMKKE